MVGEADMEFALLVEGRQVNKRTLEIIPCEMSSMKGGPRSGFILRCIE